MNNYFTIILQSPSPSLYNHFLSVNDVQSLLWCCEALTGEIEDGCWLLGGRCWNVGDACCFRTLNNGEVLPDRRLGIGILAAFRNI